MRGTVPSPIPTFVAVVLAVLCLWTPGAVAGEASTDGTAVDLAGTWRVEGRHDRHGPYRGTLVIEPRDDGTYRATRTITRADGRTEQTTGLLRVEGNEVHRVLGRAGSPGITGRLHRALEEGPDPEAEDAPETGTFGLHPTGDRMDGLFRGADGSGETGTETLTRGGRGQDEIDILVDGDEAFPAIREALEAATDHIHVETYIWKDDETGAEIAAILRRKARRGVDVRVLLDSFGSGEAEGIARSIRDAGGTVLFNHGVFSGLGSWILDGLRSVGRAIGRLFGMDAGPEPPREDRNTLNRDHRKLMVCDGRVALQGGMNIGSSYETEWHDVHSRLEGPVVRELQQAFLERWRVRGGEVADLDWDEIYPPVRGATPDPLPENADDRLARVREALRDRGRGGPAGPVRLETCHAVTTVPGVTNGVLREYLRRIRGARREIWIENAYFLDDRIIDALQAAARRGVRVVVIIPADEHNDVWAVENAFNFVRNDVIRSGVELYHYRDRMVHSKVAMVDGAWMTVGSANLDTISMERNLELNVCTEDPAGAEALYREVFAPDLPASDRARVREDSLWTDLKQGFFHIFRGWM